MLLNQNLKRLFESTVCVNAEANKTYDWQSIKLRTRINHIRYNKILRSFTIVSASIERQLTLSFPHGILAYKNFVISTSKNSVQ